MEDFIYVQTAPDCWDRVDEKKEPELISVADHVVFANSGEDAYRKICVFYGDDPDAPVSQLRCDWKYTSIKREEEKTFRGSPFNDKFLDQVAEHIQKTGDPIKHSDILYYFKHHRRHFLRAGLILDVANNLISYDKEKADKQLAKLAKKNTRRTIRAKRTFYKHEVIRLVDDMRRAVSDIQPRLRCRGYTYFLFENLILASTLMTDVFGYGSWRSLPAFVSIKEKWQHLSDKEKARHGQQLKNWFEIEVAGPVVNRKLQVRKKSIIGTQLADA